MMPSKIAVVTQNQNCAFLYLLRSLKIPFDIISDKTNLDKIRDYCALAVLTDSYPEIPRNAIVVQNLIEGMVSAEKPVFCEFLPIKNLITDQVKRKEYARMIALSRNSELLRDIEELSLFETHQNPFLLMNPDAEKNYQELLCFGRVAGVYKAVYGLPKETYTAIGKKRMLVFSTIMISDFDRAEFRLKIRFGQLLINICRHLCTGWFDLNNAEISNPFDNRKYMREITAKSETEKRSLYIQTLIRGLNWFERARMFPKPDGIGGVYEGFTSAFDHNGNKRYRFNEKLGFKVQRADCTADTAISFYLASNLQSDDTLTFELQKKYKKTAKNLFHELYSYWQHYDNDKSILHGLFGWSNSPYDHTVSYSDDNGRVTLESLLYAYISEDKDAFRRSYAAVNALRATTGKNGHRWRRIDLKDFYKKRGRKWFRKHKVRLKRYKSPHYDAWTFAALLYGAYLINDVDIIKLVRKGVDDYMKKFPDLPLEHSVGDDFSKLLVASVILYKATKDEKALNYVHEIVDFFAGYQDQTTGAFPEIDPHEKHARTEKSNQKYGTGESALYMNPTDTITDQLYSLGFLAMGLFFAHKTGKCEKAEPMLIKLIDYFCMIQLKSENTQLNGAWTRGFDYRYGEPYGANGDVGWGAYCIETGWTMGPILTSIALYLLDFDPFAPLNHDFAADLRTIYKDERQFQAEIEKNWKKYTPKPIKHQNDMNQDALNKILQDFKKNSLD